MLYNYIMKTKLNANLLKILAYGTIIIIFIILICNNFKSNIIEGLTDQNEFKKAALDKTDIFQKWNNVNLKGQTTDNFTLEHNLGLDMSGNKLKIIKFLDNKIETLRLLSLATLSSNDFNDEEFSEYYKNELFMLQDLKKSVLQMADGGSLSTISDNMNLDLTNQGKNINSSKTNFLGMFND
jgi:hypothetical protein